MFRLTTFVVPLGITLILLVCAISPAEVFAAPTSVRPNKRGLYDSSNGIPSRPDRDGLALSTSTPVVRAGYCPVQVYDHHPTSADPSSTPSTPSDTDTGAGAGVRDDHDGDFENPSAGLPDKRELLVSVPFFDSPRPVIVHPRPENDPRHLAELNEMMESKTTKLSKGAEQMEILHKAFIEWGKNDLLSENSDYIDYVLAFCALTIGPTRKWLQEARQLHKDYQEGRTVLKPTMDTFIGMISICEEQKKLHPKTHDDVVRKLGLREAQSASRNGQSAHQDAQPAQPAHRDDHSPQAGQSAHQDDHSPQAGQSVHRDSEPAQPAHWDSQTTQESQPAQPAHRNDLSPHASQSAHRDSEPAQPAYRDGQTTQERQSAQPPHQDSQSAHRDGQPAGHQNGQSPLQNIESVLRDGHPWTHQDSQCANQDGHSC
ncbi:hypothetical protein EV360DRAFT_90560 [Lentinula raphanica]|nr:hypothetical protein EV360DRAFT_90560 [Lentinula raphanica]